MKELAINTLDELSGAAQQLLDYCENKRILLFYGEMGSGKTTFIKEICKVLGVTDTTSSPTFSIVNEYQTEKGETLFHFDFYRLKNEQEALDMGCNEYFYSGNYCFVEWPEKIKSLIPPNSVRVSIKETGGNTRMFQFN